MSRNLDTSLAAALSNNLIQPVVLAVLTFVSGTMYVWSGVGNLVYNGNTYLGVGLLGKISAISENSDVKADGMDITLSGIGLSPYAIAALPVPPGVSNPVTPAAGQSVAWSLPTEAGAGTSYSGNGANAYPSGGSLTQNYAISLDFNTDAFCAWYGFKLPDLPDDAVIQGIIPVAQAVQLSGVSGGGFRLLAGNGVNPASGIDPNAQTALEYDATTLQYQGSSIGTTLTEQMIAATLWSTVDNIYPSDPPSNISYAVSFIGFAIYYTTATNAYSLVNDAVNDFQAGAPAQVYFGLMNNGALIGSPYLILSGQMDQPIIDTSTETASITISLENKLSNLLRPTARRYTAADQHLQYPDDIGFNWVEFLNDIALRWGAQE
jgi:hypothetical protein